MVISHKLDQVKLSEFDRLKDSSVSESNFFGDVKFNEFQILKLLIYSGLTPVHITKRSTHDSPVFKEK